MAGEKQLAWFYGSDFGGWFSRFRRFEIQYERDTRIIESLRMIEVCEIHANPCRLSSIYLYAHYNPIWLPEPTASATRHSCKKRTPPANQPFMQASSKTFMIEVRACKPRQDMISIPRTDPIDANADLCVYDTSEVQTYIPCPPLLWPNPKLSGSSLLPFRA